MKAWSSIEELAAHTDAERGDIEFWLRGEPRRLDAGVIVFETEAAVGVILQRQREKIGGGPDVSARAPRTLRKGLESLVETFAEEMGKIQRDLPLLGLSPGQVQQLRDMIDAAKWKAKVIGKALGDEFEQ